MSRSSVIDRHAVAPVLALGFFTAAVLVRVSLAGPAKATSTSAALVFALLLVTVAVISRTHTVVNARTITIGVLTAAVLVAPAWAHLGFADRLTMNAFPRWAALTVVVAGAEEAFLRGALYDLVAKWRSTDAAIVIAAAAFALMHVPLYGWHVLPLDFAVGLALGAARLIAGSWTAPAIAHIGADIAGWWLI
jgi:membrane protease YdiL (CAAX protease family)